VYDVINRGNTRSPLFRAERTKQGNLHEVSRKVNAWTRSVDKKQETRTPIPKPRPRWSSFVVG
jgi:hypothetical protein